MIKLPTIFNQPIAFEPAQVETDDLLTSVENDPVMHDNVWVLDEEIDADALGKFWDDALRELKESDSEES